MKFTNRSLLLTSCTLISIASPVAAQNAAPEARAENVIIVTAQNRAENLQDVPIVIDVIDAEGLEDAGFSSANDLSKIAPVAQVQQDQGTVNVFVRGIGTIAGNDTAVVSNIDGEYINDGSVLGISIFDLERVEVLRGPQGTLYGRNSTAGAVNFIARKPGDEFEANASASYGNFNSIRLDSGVTVPLGTGVGLRAAAFYEDRDGYVKHPAFPGGNFGFEFPAYAAGRSDDNNAYGGRLSFLAEDMGGLTVYLAGEYSDRSFTPQTFTYADLNATGNTPGPNCGNPGFERRTIPNDPHVYCVPDSTNFLNDVNRSEYPGSANGLGERNSESWAIRGRLEYEFSPAATLSYIAGYREFSSNNVTPLPVVYTNYGFIDEAETQSHELRLAGDIGGGIIYQVGAFYFKEATRSEGGFYLGSPTDGFFLEYTNNWLTSDSLSAFGQVEVPITDQITAVGGLRYTDNQREALQASASPFGPMGPDFALFAPPMHVDFDDLRYTSIAPLSSEDNKVTWLAGINYEPNVDTLIYAKVTTGFKAGGFNPLDANQNPTAGFEPETNTAYEAGIKRTFGSVGQHLVNISGFYYDYTDLQVSTILSTVEGGRTYNAGSATLWGIEAEGSFEITENTFLSLTANYLNSEIKELFASYNVICVSGPNCDDITSVPVIPNDNPNGDPNPGTDYSGNRLAFAPEWILTANLQHTFDLGGSGSLTFSAGTMFKSQYFTSFRNQGDDKQDSFTQSDLQLEFNSEDEAWSAAVFVRNIENERPLSQGYFLSAGPDDIYNWQFGSPRLYGVRLGYEF